MAAPTTEKTIDIELTPTRINKRRVIAICLAIVAAVAVATITIGAALHINGLNQQLSSLQHELDGKNSTISSQQGALSSQSEALESQASELKAKDETIKSQEDKIKDQQNQINNLNSQLVAKRPSTSPKKPTYTTVAPANDGKKYVALTFDDGPGPYTAGLLDAMKARGVKATFYLLGTKVNRYPDILRRMDAEGHAIGNHSNDHPQLTALSAANIAANMNACADKIRAIVGHDPVVMRCPYGSCNANVRSYAESKGISITFWSVDTNDWRYSGLASAAATDKIFANTFKSGSGGIRNGSIVLMHDIHKNSVTAAIKMMDRLIAEGYTLVTVPELLLKREGGAIPGKVYS